MTTVAERRRGRRVREKRPVGKDPLDDLMTPPKPTRQPSKDELHRMLVEAVRNTAAMTPPKEGRHGKSKPKAARASRSG